RAFHVTGVQTCALPISAEVLDSVQSWTQTPGVLSDPATFLRDHGLQVTAQRLAVLRAVAAHPHSTANALVEAVRQEIGAISRQRSEERRVGHGWRDRER